MKDEDKIYGLVVQAEEIQQHAVHLQQEAKNAVAEVRQAMSEVQSDTLKADMLRVLFFAGVALVVVLAVTVATTKGLGWYVTEKRAELTELSHQITEARDTLAALESKTWRLQLVEQGKERAVVLPKGVKIARTGMTQDGRTAIVVTP